MTHTQHNGTTPTPPGRTTTSPAQDRERPPVDTDLLTDPRRLRTADPTPEAIVIEGLSKSYGDHPALVGLDLTVRHGEVLGFLGPNGAGKSTTIQILLDIIRPSAGTTRVFGLDPRTDGVELRHRIGFLPGDFVVDPRSTADAVLDHLARLRRDVDPGFRRELVERLGLDPSRRIGDLSTGNRQKVGLIQALMHRPDLLILDEPTSGLDPVVQREFHDLVSEASANGQTVFMSSHVLSEIEATAHRVAIINAGRLVALEEMTELRQRPQRRVEATFDRPPTGPDFDAIDGIRDSAVSGHTVTATLVGSPGPLLAALASRSVVSLTIVEPPLENLFFDAYTKEPIRHEI